MPEPLGPMMPTIRAIRSSSTSAGTEASGKGAIDPPRTSADFKRADAALSSIAAVELRRRTRGSNVAVRFLCDGVSQPLEPLLPERRQRRDPDIQTIQSHGSGGRLHVVERGEERERVPTQARDTSDKGTGSTGAPGRTWCREVGDQVRMSARWFARAEGEAILRPARQELQHQRKLERRGGGVDRPAPDAVQDRRGEHGRAKRRRRADGDGSLGRHRRLTKERAVGAEGLAASGNAADTNPRRARHRRETAWELHVGQGLKTRRKTVA